MTDHVDIAVIGAGAAGLMAGYFAALNAPKARVVVLDGAAKLGAKILVAGGGRCNVTHFEVSPEAYAGSSRNAIRKVLLQFDVPQTIEFFEDIGVELKQEANGKLFPITDSARTVLEALLRAVRGAGASVRHPFRIDTIDAHEDGFLLSGETGNLSASRIILATGGKSLPKSGSDGGGYRLAQSMGHTLTEKIFPALVPLLLPAEHPLRGLSGLTTDVTLTVRDSRGSKMTELSGALLCTHFGLSGPAVLDISRYYNAAHMDDRQTTLTVNWLPGQTSDTLLPVLQANATVTVNRWLSDQLPDRLARVIVTDAALDPAQILGNLTRSQRNTLINALTAMVLPISGDRGYTYAEVTAGGVPLSELDLKTMQSRVTPGLHLVGEILDVDGRIGGYNFQWAWASGYVAGVAAARAL
jgi:predicted Rossmann fold flavoprotein